MREILFRGKSLENGEWLEGDLRHGGYFKKDQTTYIVKTDLFILNYPVDPETVGQYTGLTDKNGTKIFEGDIVNIDLFHPKGLANYETGYIKYVDTKARFVFHTNEGEYSYDNTDRFEIIGNIHDNPELPKGE